MLEQLCAPLHYHLDEVKADQLEARPNPYLNRDMVEHLVIPDFTCLCPRSGFPDFACITIDYVPDRYVVELKSLKLYMNGYRDRQVGHEASPNTILSDLVDLLDPCWMRVVADFSIRGNIKTLIFAEYAQLDYAGVRPEYQRYRAARNTNIVLAGM